jgi:hypothetical protein
MTRDNFFWDIENIFKVDSSKKIIPSFKVTEYPTVHRNDWEPVSIIEPDLKQGPWIAGGAPLRWYQDMPVGENDIDIFCANARQVDDVIARIRRHNNVVTKYDSENAKTLEYSNTNNVVKRWTLQIIKRRYFNSLLDVINSFDITVCQIGTSGTEWEMSPFTAKDIRERNLRFKLPLQSDSVKRLIKYWTYGYRPVEGTMEAIKSNPLTNWQFNVDEDYQNAF